MAGVIGKEAIAPTAVMTAPIGGGATGLARVGKMAAAGGAYEGASGAMEQIAREGEVIRPGDVVERAALGAVAAPVLDAAIRGVGRALRPMRDLIGEALARRSARNAPPELVAPEPRSEPAARVPEPAPMPPRAPDADRLRGAPYEPIATSEPAEPGIPYGEAPRGPGLGMETTIEGRPLPPQEPAPIAPEGSTVEIPQGSRRASPDDEELLTDQARAIRDADENLDRVVNTADLGTLDTRSIERAIFRLSERLASETRRVQRGEGNPDLASSMRVDLDWLKAESHRRRDTAQRGPARVDRPRDDLGPEPLEEIPESALPLDVERPPPPGARSQILDKRPERPLEEIELVDEVLDDEGKAVSLTMTARVALDDVEERADVLGRVMDCLGRGTSPSRCFGQHSTALEAASVDLATLRARAREIRADEDMSPGAAATIAVEELLGRVGRERRELAERIARKGGRVPERPARPVPMEAPSADRTVPRSVDEAEPRAAPEPPERPAGPRSAPEPDSGTPRLDEAAHEAATSPHNALPEPTEAMKDAGNYKVGRVRLHGMDISIENPRGSVRSGKSASGRTWSTEMAHHYGYIRGTVGKDKDHVDVFLGPDAENPDLPVFVVNQIDPASGKFDEHKVLMGFADEDAARTGYLANYAKGWKGAGSIARFETVDDFKAWAADPAATKRPAPVRGGARAQIQAKREANPRAAMAPGARYTGFVRDEAAGAHPRKPIRREDVLRPFLKALGVPLYQGRVKGKNRLGFYLPGKEAVRVKRHADLETTAHELAHLLDDRDPAIRKSWTDGPNAATYAEELRGVSYDRTKLYEGFAEFVRLWMTQPREAQAAAPKFTEFWERYVAESRIGAAIRDARKGMQAWFGQDALSRARSKIGKPPSSLTDLADPLDHFRQSVADDLHGLYRMERELTGGIQSGGAYETARLSRAAYAIVDGALRIGAPVVKPDGAHAFEGKGLEEILKPVSRRLDDWIAYAVGRSARELKGQGRENLFTTTEIDAMVGLETPLFRRAFDEYQAWNRAIVDFAEAKGLINPAGRALWQRTQYLPFHRVGQRGPSGHFEGIEGHWSGIKRLRGGTQNLRDPLTNMVANAGHLITEALRNEARLAIVDLASEVTGGGRFLVKIPKTSTVVKVDKEQIRRFALQAFGLRPADVKAGNVPPEMVDAIAAFEKRLALQPGYVAFWLHGQAPKGGNVIAAMRGGKPEFYEVADDLLYRSVAALNRPGKHWLIRFLGAFRRIGQSSITLSVDFITANMARDTLMAGVMSRHGFKPFLDSLRGMKSRLAKDESYREFLANGGGFASYLTDDDAMRRHLERFYGARGISLRNVINTPGKLLYAFEHLADAFEMSARLGEYRRARAAGASPQHAAYLGREVSTDFAMRGDSQALGALYDTVMFLKAGINGLDRGYRGIVHDPNRAHIAARTALLAGASMGLYALNRGNPLYEQLEDWDRDTHWHVFVPTAKYHDFVEQHGREPATPEEAAGLFEHFRYPKIWEIGAVASIAERTAEQLLNEADGKDVEAAKFAKDVSRVTLDLFNLSVIPQALAPLYEQATNRDTFTGRPIENQSLESMEPWARAHPGTAQVLQDLGEATRDNPRWAQVPPARAEALVRGYLNTWAAYGLMLADAATHDDKPDLRVDQYPALKRFYAEEPARHTRFETEFYKLLREATEVRRTMRYMDRRNRPDLAEELERKPGNEEYAQLQRLNKEVSGIRAEMKAIYDDREMPPAEKRRQLDAKIAEKNRVLREGVEDIERQRKEKTR